MQVAAVKPARQKAEPSNLESIAKEVFARLSADPKIGLIFEEYGIVGGLLLSCDTATKVPMQYIRIGNFQDCIDPHVEVILACVRRPYDPGRGSSRETRMQEHHRDCAAAVVARDAIYGFRFVQKPGTQAFSGDTETAEFSDLCELFIFALARRMLSRTGTRLLNKGDLERSMPRYEDVMKEHFSTFV